LHIPETSNTEHPQSARSNVQKCSKLAIIHEPRQSSGILIPKRTDPENNNPVQVYDWKEIKCPSQAFTHVRDTLPKQENKPLSEQKQQKGKKPCHLLIFLGTLDQ